MIATTTNALKAYKFIEKLVDKPIIYGSVAFNIITASKNKIHDIDILVSIKDLPLLAQKIKGAKYHKKFETVHAKINGIKVELDAKERWGPKRITITKVIHKKQKITIVSKKTLIWFYKRGKKESHKLKYKNLRT